MLPLQNSRSEATTETPPQGYRDDGNLLPYRISEHNNLKMY